MPSQDKNQPSANASAEGQTPSNTLLPGHTAVDPDALATSDDLDVIRGASVPPARNKNPQRGLGAWFTPEVLSTLSNPQVAGYFGTRIKLSELVSAATRYAKMDALRTRLEHTASLAAQIAAPDGALIEDDLSRLMASQTWSDFTKDHPRHAMALEALKTSWSGSHPGGKGRKKATDEKADSKEPPKTK